MMKRTLAIAALLLLPPAAFAAEPQPRMEGIESPDYVWNEMQGEKLQALRAKGDALRGEIAFEVCQGCHRGRATGRADGTYPRLAGQHPSVLIKQMTDVRAGRRDNPKMVKAIKGYSDAELQVVADYISRMPVATTK